ncbi:hypothetical protein [Ralstonia pseudosolanacearum]|uniref:Uncharacterized protein n=2 Tax=root TaxID=1 RepID=A0A077K9T6_9CAUD|nr:hypothetical protein [Ralstonia pseudosolanacearum]YP_009067123.1 hypothetical protein MA18_gp46 [Ralstonia phage RSY1]APC68768.1 hypothetical protein RSOE_17480 [Ralstonia solanacearum OE1-1]QKL92069.1 hypothetical protein HI802_08075 [Ralstonia solanacearum]MCQ4681201.1 hypothetical protein [Ralstonia pseudosolanacearum]MDC6285857.1 hypothetical protein [Ralstonia pseudosolanacearum]QKL97144.1 hypothetical protein HI801_08075 [Ralstonia solanacearum]
MAKQAVTESDVRWAHRFLRLTTPYEAMPPQLRAAVTAAASALAPKFRRRPTHPPAVDLKRRAAGELDD